MTDPVLRDRRAPGNPEPPGRHSAHGPPAGSISEQVAQNVEEIGALQRREHDQVTAPQRRIERLGRLIGTPAYLAGLLGFCAVWVLINTIPLEGFEPFDPAPFPRLEGLLTLLALITTTVVLIGQNRQARLEQQHAHLDLQVNLLTEQKVTKLINLIEELRRDLPMVKDRHDSHAAVLQEGADTEQVVSAIENVGLGTQPD